MTQDAQSSAWTRRQLLEMLGLGAIAATLPEFASAAAPTFPKGAVIRTILKDYAPEELAGGATLFHEHLSFADDFMTRWNGYAAATRAANGVPATAAGAADEAVPSRGRGTPPPAPSGPFFMQDLDLMTEETDDRQDAKASAASSTAGIPTWAATSTSCGRCRPSPGCRSSRAAASTRSRSTRRRSRR